MSFGSSSARRRLGAMVAAGAIALATFGGAAPGAVAGGRTSAGVRAVARPAAGRPAAGYDARTAGTAVAVGPRIAKARSSLARSLGTLGVLQSDPVTGTLRYVGRLDGFLTEASTAPASAVALRYVRANRRAFGLRARRPEDAPAARRLRRRPRHPPPLVDPAGGRPDPVRSGVAGQRREGRPPDQRGRRSDARAPRTDDDGAHERGRRDRRRPARRGLDRLPTHATRPRWPCSRRAAARVWPGPPRPTSPRPRPTSRSSTR